ncbi:MAG TPA: hypothetical protein ENN60_04245, partial [archaeon]|nr:hypothetical protein [archaeon]
MVVPLSYFKENKQVEVEYLKEKLEAVNREGGDIKGIFMINFSDSVGDLLVANFTKPGEDASLEEKDIIGIYNISKAYAEEKDVLSQNELGFAVEMKINQERYIMLGGEIKTEDRPDVVFEIVRTPNMALEACANLFFEGTPYQRFPLGTGKTLIKKLEVYD